MGYHTQNCVCIAASLQAPLLHWVFSGLAMDKSSLQAFEHRKESLNAMD